MQSLSFYQFTITIYVYIIYMWSSLESVQKLIKMNSYQTYGGDLHSNSRSKFVTKVYSILCIQLAITALFVVANIYIPAFAHFQYVSRFFYFLAFIGVIIPLLALSFSRSLSTSFPNNMILLAVFTLSESYLVSSITSIYEPESVLMSAVATAAATFGITFHAMTTKSDYTQFMHSFYAFASSVFWIFLFLSMFNVFFFRSSFIVNLMAFVIAGIYSIYILVDTQFILGGKKKELTLDNYVMGAMILYIDIIGLFLKILQLLGDRKKD